MAVRKKGGMPFHRADPCDHTIDPGANLIGATDLSGVAFAERYPDELVPQGISAELIAAKWGLTRSSCRGGWVRPPSGD